MEHALLQDVRTTLIVTQADVGPRREQSIYAVCARATAAVVYAPFPLPSSAP